MIFIDYFEKKDKKSCDGCFEKPGKMDEFLLVILKKSVLRILYQLFQKNWGKHEVFRVFLKFVS